MLVNFLKTCFILFLYDCNIEKSYCYLAISIERTRIVVKNFLGYNKLVLRIKAVAKHIPEQILQFYQSNFIDKYNESI